MGKPNRFVETADLAEYDLSQFKPVHFELRREDKAVSLGLPAVLLDEVKRIAAQQGIPYQRFMRQAIERVVTTQPPARERRTAEG